MSALEARGGDTGTMLNSHHLRGFTLVEILVVIAIIAVLAGLLVPTLRGARMREKKTRASNDMQALALALETYNGEYGDYPPTSLEEAYQVSGNGIDDGIESLLAHLASRSRGGPYLVEFDEERITNLDEDTLDDAELLERLDWLFGDAQLREYVDPFGRPYVYMHSRDYGKSYRVTTSAGGANSVSARQSPQLMTFRSPRTFQIWSLGQDGKPDGDDGSGEGDDIGSW